MNDKQQLMALGEEMVERRQNDPERAQFDFGYLPEADTPPHNGSVTRFWRPLSRWSRLSPTRRGQTRMTCSRQSTRQGK